MSIPKRPNWKARVVSGAALLCASAAWAAQNPSPELPKPPPNAASEHSSETNEQMRMREQAAQKLYHDATHAERRKQLAADAARLLNLATELKTEVDKTDKEMLSLTVVRKAEAIERLAHGMKDKMKLGVGPS